LIKYYSYVVVTKHLQPLYAFSGFYTSSAFAVGARAPVLNPTAVAYSP